MPKYMLLERIGTKSIFKQVWRRANKVYAEAYYKQGSRWHELQTFMPSISYQSLRHMGAKAISQEDVALILLDNR